MQANPNQNLLALPWYDLLSNEATAQHDEDDEEYYPFKEEERFNADEEEPSEWMKRISRHLLQKGQTEKLSELMERIQGLYSSTAESGVSDEKTMRSIVSSFLSSQELSDMTISSSDDEVIPCHQCVLRLYSDYFAALLGENWITEQDSTLRNVDCDAYAACIRLMLRYFYGENIFDLSGTLEVEKATGCYALSHYWMCPSFTLEEIEEFVFTHVTEDTCIYVLTFAETYALTRIKDKCFTFAIHCMAFETEDPAELSQLSSGMKETMLALQRSCSLVSSRHGFEIESVREMVGMLGESLWEEERVLEQSLSRNNEDMVKCVNELEALEQTGNISRLSGLLEWKKRLLKVQDCLDRQAAAVNNQKRFYNQQRKCLEALNIEIS